MIRLKRSINLAAILFLIGSSGFCQNLYDIEHSKKYADFLFQSQQYNLAAMEFERLVFMDPANNEFRLNLIKSFRKSGQALQGLSHIELWYPERIDNPDLFLELTKLNLIEGRYENVLSDMNNQSLISLEEKDYYRLSAILLDGNWNGAQDFIKNQPSDSWPGFSQLCDLSYRQQQIRYRRPGTALALSAVVPGLGKVYSHDWKDGIISFLFVATNAFQAYRGFSKNGISSVYGWVFGSLSVGFYAGNLFGSWKSAKDYNHRSEEILYNEIQNSVFDRF